MRARGYSALWMVVIAACGTDPAPPAPPPVAAIVEEPAPPAIVAPTEDRYAASHVVIAWSGAVSAPATVTRTEAEAEALAAAVAKRAQAGEDIAALARELSDSPSGHRGGSVGVYLTGTMVPEFEAAVAQVEVGGVTAPVKTPFGWHVIRRDAIVQARVAHVLIAFQGADRAQVVRTEAEARVRAEEVLARIARGDDFAAVAREMSDDPSASAGGDIGLVAPGQMVPAFEAAVFALTPGQHSGVVETPYGLHVVLRIE